MRFFLIFTALFLCTPVLTAHARWIGSRAPAKLEFKILEYAPNRTVVEIKVHGFSADPVMINSQEFQKISIPGLNAMDTRGLPALPRFRQNLAIPAGASARIKIRKIESVTYSLGDVLPSKGAIERNINPATVPYTFASFYSVGDTFPASLVSLGTPFQLRAVRGVNLSFYPVQLHRSSRTVTLINRAVIEIQHPTPAGMAVKMLRSDSNREDADFLGIYRHQFPNFQGLQLRINTDHVIPDNGSVLIISHDSFRNAIAPIVRWRRQTGRTTKLVTVGHGRSSQQIKQIIQQEYDTNRTAYVLLVGDAEFIPTHPGTAGNALNHEADPMYALVDGNDTYPDLVVSRLSVKTNEELRTIVAKTLRYEQHPEVGGAWYSRATGIASNEGSPTDYERLEILRNLLLGWHYDQMDQIYQPNDVKADLFADLNQGRGYVNYTGHGTETYWVTSRFSNSDIPNLRNGDRVPVIVSVACVNGRFAEWPNDVFAEVWLKAGTPSESRGALAVFAASTNQSWVPPTVGQKEITELLVSETFTTVGALLFHGSIAVLEDNSSTAVQTFETWHIFGDGTVQMRTQAPTTIAIPTRQSNLVFPELVWFEYQNLGDTRIFAGAVQNGRIVGKGVSDQDGKLRLRFTQRLEAGSNVTLTFTGFNKIPIQQEIRVVDLEEFIAEYSK